MHLIFTFTHHGKSHTLCENVFCGSGGAFQSLRLSLRWHADCKFITDSPSYKLGALVWKIREYSKYEGTKLPVPQLYGCKKMTFLFTDPSNSHMGKKDKNKKQHLFLQ